MSRIARKILERYDAHRITQSAVVTAWESHIIDAAEFGVIIGEAS